MWESNNAMTASGRRVLITQWVRVALGPSNRNFYNVNGIPAR